MPNFNTKYESNVTLDHSFFSLFFLLASNSLQQKKLQTEETNISILNCMIDCIALKQ